MHHAKKTENFSPGKVNTCVSSILNNETGLCESEKKNDKILHKFSLLWTSRNKLAWCLHLLLCGHRWTDTPHPVQSPVAYSFLLQTHSPGEKHEQLNEIKIQTCEKPIERQQKCSPRCLKIRFACEGKDPAITLFNRISYQSLLKYRPHRSPPLPIPTSKGKTAVLNQSVLALKTDHTSLICLY